MYLLTVVYVIMDEIYTMFSKEHDQYVQLITQRIRFSSYQATAPFPVCNKIVLIRAVSLSIQSISLFGCSAFHVCFLTYQCSYRLR